MIPVQQAVKTALTQLNAIMPQYAGADARLEEVEFEEKDDAWLITFSAPVPPNPSQFARVLEPQAPFGSGRSAKVVKLRASDGEFISVKQRVV